MIATAQSDEGQLRDVRDLPKDSEFDKSLNDAEIRQLLLLSAQAVVRSRRHEIAVSHVLLEQEGYIVRMLNVELLQRETYFQHPQEYVGPLSMHTKKVAFAFRNSESLHLAMLGLLALIGFSITAISLGQPIYQSVLAGSKYILTTAGVGAGIFAVAFLVVQGAYRARTFYAKVFMFSAALLMTVEVALFVYFVLTRFAGHG